jgi:thiosulfate/3-mercaptopyruvate sulfurtransferase
MYTITGSTEQQKDCCKTALISIHQGNAVLSWGMAMASTERRQDMNKISVIWVIGLLIAASCGGTSAAEWANPQILATPEIVKKNIDNPDWIIVDCRPLPQYINGHIPGAISLGRKCDKALRDSTDRAFRDISKYERLLGKVGISNDTHVVFYHGDQWTLLDASVGFWILEYLGHDKAYLLDGGINAWRKAGYRLDKKPARKESKIFKAHVVASRYGSTDEVLQVAQATTPGVQLLDSRTMAEHNGSEVHSLRGGHIPNTTINVSHETTLATQKNRKSGKLETIEYLDPDATSKAFATLDKNKRTIAYCHTGTRAAMTYLQLRLLGFKDPANYDESWRVYGSNVSYPVESEQWFDFWNAQWKVEDLERRMKELEKQLAKKK